MMKTIYSALASALLLTLAPAEAPSASATHEGHEHAHQRKDERLRRRASKARRRSRRRAISYACPMHPDMVSNTPGECPKCGMALVAVRRGAKAAAAGGDATAGDDKARSRS